MSENTKDGFGLDKSARAQAARDAAEKDEQEKDESLQPPFPYSMVPFDPEFFGV